MVTTRSSSKKEYNKSSVISGFTDDVAAIRGDNTSPIAAITQPDTIDCKHLSVGGSSDDVSARGDNNPSAGAIAQPQDCKYSSVSGSSDDVTARGYSPSVVAITQPDHTQTENADTDTILTQNTTSSYNINRELATIRSKEKNRDRMRKKRAADLEYKATENDNRKQNHDEVRKNKDLNKATFATTVGDMFKKDKNGKVKLNTEGYETKPNGGLGPEVAVMNMHMASKNRLQEIEMKILMKDPTEDNRNRVLEIIQGQMITPERQHSKAIEFFHETGRGCDWDDSSSKHSINDKDTKDAQLVACACCGIHDFYSQKKIESGIRTYEMVPLDKLSILQLDQEAVEEYKDQLKDYIKVPYNEEGDMKVIHPWKVRSIYQYSGNYYYLHQEMVEQSNSSKCPQAAICNVCKSKIDSGTKASKITNSIASGVDFGNPDRLEVTFKKPTLREHLLMALVRPYATIIKLQNKNSYKHACLQSAIKGSSIVFEHDSPQVVSNLLSTESMNSNMCIHFVGAKGEFDSMIKRTLDQRTADIYGRPYVIFQWLKLLSKVNKHYQCIGIEEMEFQTLKELVDKSNGILVENHEKIIDSDAQERNEQMTDDVAGIRSPPANSNEETTDSDDNLDLQYSYLATKKSTPNKSKEDSTNAYLRSAAKTIGVNLSEEEEKYNASKSYRSEAPVNEFEKGEFGLVAGFPHVCLLGTAYNKKSCNLSESDCLHLLMQYTNIPATCKLLIFYLFDIKRRHQNVYGMSAKVKGDSVAFDKFVSEFSSSNFQDRLRQGVKNPSGKDAKYVLSKLMPVLVTAGKHTTLGSLERNSSVGEMLAMIRRHGSTFDFLTGTVDDVHNPNVLRLSSKQFSNTDYPSLCPTDFLEALKTGKDYKSTTIDMPTNWTAMKEQVNGNPVASAFMYKRLVYAVTKVLVGLKSSTTSGSGNRTVKSKRTTEDTWIGTDNGVIISNTDAYCGVHECSGRGALHFHICLFGGVSPFILQNGVDDAKIRNAITKCLDTMFSSQLPSNFHVKKLVEKELSHYPGGNPTIRKGRAQLILPNPVKKEEFENHVYTTVSDCGIHSHEWNRIGTCHKPPRGLTGCRLNKPDNPIHRTGPVQLKEMTRTEDVLKYRVLNEIRDEGKDKGEFDIETLEEAKITNDSQTLHPLDDPDPRLIIWQIASPNIDPNMSLPELADCADYQTLTTARKKEYIIESLSDAMKMDNKDTYNADNGYDFQTTVPIKIKKRKKPPGSDNITPHHTNKIAKTCIPEDMNIDVEKELFNDALSHHSNKVAKAQTEDTKVIDKSEHDKTNGIDVEERHNRKRKRCRDDHNIVVCVHCTNRNSPRPPTLYNNECVHVAKSARINVSDTKSWIPRRSDSLSSDSSYDEDNPTENDDDDENNSSLEEDGSNDEEIQSITALFRVMKLLGTLAQIRPNDDEVQKIISSLEGLDLEEIEMIYANVRKRLKGMNGYVVQYNKLLTALLGCNTNSMLLGSTEQSKAATFYIGPYIDKNKNPLIESLDIVLKAMDLARKYPSVADDSDTPRRITQFIMTKILNQLNNLMEVSDTQAAAGLLGISAGMCSDKFIVYDANCHNNFVSDECKVDLTTDNTDSGTDDDTYIYSSMDDSSLNDNNLYSDSEDSDMIPSEVEINDITSDLDCDHLPDKPDRNESLPYYNSAYGSYPLYKGNDNQLIPVPYPLLYRCRDEEMKELNRYEYFSCVEIIRNKKDTLTDTQHKERHGRKESTHYPFSDDFPLHDSHHQILRSKQCTLKLYANPPSPPGKTPSEDSPDYKQWKKKADIYAKYLLVLFRSERTLYNQSRSNHLKYDWEAFVQFVADLREGDKTNEQNLRNACILGEMTDLITGTKTNFYKRMILSHYRARNRTIWSEQQQAEGFAQYRHMKQNIRTDDYDDIDNEIDDLVASNILSDYQERQIMQRVAYSDQLIRQLKTSSKPITDGNLRSNDRSTHEVGDQLHIKTVPFNEGLSYRILEDPSNDQIEGDDFSPSNESTDSTNASAMDARVEAFIKSKKLSLDKRNAVQTMYKHFKEVLYNDEVNDPPNLLIVGAPGTGKSWLVDIISEIATIHVGLQEPIKSAFMGIAAINIGGSTINSLFDIPINLSKQYKNETKPWNSDLLMEFKRKYNLDKVSTIIIDEISMVKPWMLTYIDARMKEAMQSDKPFGGKALIMLGDFDQCPPVGGNTMPHLAMEMLEGKIWSQRNYLSNVSSQKRKSKRSRFELESSLTRRGVQIFKSAGLMELSIQHRSAKDQDHTNLLKKMSSGSKVKTADLKNYKTLSANDMTPDGFLFAPVIVTGNYERRAINSFQAKMYAMYHNTHVVRWKRKIGSKWDNKPTNVRALEEARDEPCFWEYFVPGAPAFLTTNINVNNDLANGTEVRMDSLSFQSPEDEEYLSEMIKSEPFGSVINMPNPPSAINVELYADDVWDSSETKKKNANKRSEWKVGSVVNDDRVVVPISLQHNKSDFGYDNVRGKGGAIRFRASRVLLADNFPIELGFSYTVNKSQGRTIRKEIVSLSEHPDPLLTFTWEKFYTVISRIQQNPDIRLLLKGGGRSTINYIANLEKDKYTALYFKGFPQTGTSRIRYWDETLAAKAARFI